MARRKSRPVAGGGKPGRVGDGSRRRRVVEGGRIRAPPDRCPTEELPPRKKERKVCKSRQQIDDAHPSLGFT
jgi:hypothetical protein